MHKSWLLCVLLGTLTWGQAAPGAPAQAPAPAVKPPAPAPQPDAAAALPPETAVITVHGVCPPQPKPAAQATAPATKPASAAKTPAADCKTVITKAEFEKLLKGIPNANPQIKRNIANALPRFVAWANAATKKGMDKTPQFTEMVKFAKMQILTNQLQQSIQEEAAKVPEEEIATYYKKNPEAFEQYNLDRLFVPRTKQVEAEAKEEEKEEKEEKLTDEQQKAKQAEEKAKQEQGEQQMTKLAQDLQARAAAGEDIAKLQKEAFDAAGMKIESPSVNLPNVRRTGLPPSHAAVFDLKPGDVSQVISDSGGHYAYKLKSKQQLPLEQVKEEIHRTLQNQRLRDLTDKINNSFNADISDAYFGPAGPGTNMAPPARMPRPRMAPSPTAPAAPGGVGQKPAPPAQTPPPNPPAAQPPAAKPN